MRIPSGAPGDRGPRSGSRTTPKERRQRRTAKRVAPERSQAPEPDGEGLRDWQKCEARMEGESPRLEVVINGVYLTDALLDTGASCYAAISEDLFQTLQLPLIPITKRKVKGAS